MCLRHARWMTSAALELRVDSSSPVSSKDISVHATQSKQQENTQEAFIKFLFEIKIRKYWLDFDSIRWNCFRPSSHITFWRDYFGYKNIYQRKGKKNIYNWIYQKVLQKRTCTVPRNYNLLPLRRKKMKQRFFKFYPQRLAFEKKETRRQHSLYFVGFASRKTQLEQNNLSNKLKFLRLQLNWQLIMHVFKMKLNSN